MENRVVVFFSVILLISLFIAFSIRYIVPQYQDEVLLAENEDLQTQLASLQVSATVEANQANARYVKLMETMVVQQTSFTITMQAIQERDEKVNLTATSMAARSISMANDLTAIASTVTSVNNNFMAMASTATARAPATTRVVATC